MFGRIFRKMRTEADMMAQDLLIIKESMQTSQPRMLDVLENQGA